MLLAALMGDIDAAEAAMDTVRALFDRFAEYIDSELQPVGYEVLVHGTNP